MAKEKIIIWKQHFACKTAGTLKQRNKFLRSFDDDRLEGSLRLRRCMQSFFTGGGGGGVEEKGVHRIWERAIFEVASHGCKDQHAGYHLALLPVSRHHPSSRHLTAH